MSGGTSARTNYPAPILEGLWSGTNNAFGGLYGNSGANQQASNNSSELISQYMNNPGAQGVFGGYNPSQTAQVSNQFVGNAGQLAGLGQQGYGTLTGAGQQQYNALTGFGNNAYNQFVGQGNQIYNNYNQEGNNLVNQGLGMAQTAYNAGFDPQQALFNQQYQLQQQQNLASQAQAGVATTPYGAGLTSTGNQNFDINWQNQQLARQNEAAQTAQGLLGAYGGLGQQYIGQGLNALNAGNQLGTNAYLGANQAGINALTGAYGTAGSNAANLANAGTTQLQAGANTGLAQNQYSQQQIQQQIQDYLAYLGQGTSGASAWNNAVVQDYGAATGQYGAANNAQANQAQINAGGLSGLGSLLGNVAGFGLGFL